MAFNKSHLFDPADQMTSSFAKALSHPVRLDILRILASQGSCPVRTLFRRYPLSKSTVSQHLEMLRETGLVNYKEEYPHVFYSLEPANFKKHIASLLEYCQKIQ